MSGPLVWLLHGSLAFVLLGLGAELPRARFAALPGQRRAVATLAVTLALMPLATGALAVAFGLEPALTSGLVLLAAMPAGPLSAAWTRLAGGDVARALWLVAVGTLASLVTVPLALWLCRATLLVAPGPALRVLALVVPSVATGLWVRRRWPVVAERLAVAARRLALALLVGAVALVATAEWQRTLEALPRVGLAVGLLNGANLALGALLCGRGGALSASVRNGTIALALAPLLAEPAAALPTVVYAAVQSCTSTLLVALLRLSSPRPGASQPSAPASTAPRSLPPHHSR